MPYIYKITNIVNNKCYIGKTSSTLEKRFKEHISDSKRHHMEKRPFYEAINKYGKDNFKIELLETVENDDIACEREQYWIKELHSYVGDPYCNGYNATMGGDSKRYYNYEIIANKYKELKSVKDVCSFFNCDRYTVQVACKEFGVEINSQPQKKKIKRIDSNGKITVYNSVIEAAHDFSDKGLENARSNISRAANKLGTAYGYVWRFIAD